MKGPYLPGLCGKREGQLEKKYFSQALLVSVWLKNKEGACSPGPIPKINRNSSMLIPSVQTVWSSDRVLPLSMRYASLALRRDVLRVGCNSSEVSSMSKIEWPG